MEMFVNDRICFFCCIQKGHKRLVDALAKLYSKVTGIEIDPMTEMLISTGASGALYTALNSFVDSGDEVIIIEPFFDMYDRLVKYAGATPKHIALKPTKVNLHIN